MTILFVSAFISSAAASAATSSGISYQGRILKPNGEPLEGANVQFRFQLRTPDTSNCLLYEEQQQIDMRNSKGAFALTLNDGSGLRTDATGWGFDKIFANRGSFTFDPATCSSGSSYSPNENDGRKLVVFFKDETMATWEPMAAQGINYVPYTFEAKQIAGFGAQNLLRFAESDGTLVNTTPLSNTQYTALVALVNGTSTAFEKSGQLAGAALPTLGSGQAGQYLSWTGTGWTTAASAVGADSISSTNIVNGSITGADLATNIAISTTNTISTSGTITSNISTARDFRIYDSDVSPDENYISIKAPASLPSNYNYVWPSSYGLANQVLTTDGSGVLTWAAGGSTSQWVNGASNAISYSAGNVGIGTTTPAHMLSLLKEGNSQSILMEAYRSAEYHNTLAGRAARGTQTAPLFLASDQMLGMSASAWNGTGFTNAAGIHMYGKGHSATSLPTDIRFYTTDTNATAWREVMRVTEGGGVGIGTTATTNALLDVQLLQTDTNSPNTAASFIHRTTLTADSSIRPRGFIAKPQVSVASGVTSSSGITGGAIYSYRNFEVAGDNGTMANAYGLQVSYGHYNNFAVTPQTSGSVYGLSLQPAIRSGTIAGNIYDIYLTPVATGGSLTGNHYGLYSSDPNATTYLAGKVGIGTTSPAFPFEVAGDLAIFGAGMGGTATQKFAMKSNTSGGWFEVPLDASNNKLNFSVNWRGGGTPGIFMTGATGNVGLGTTAPSAGFQLRAGTTTNAPLKFLQGPLLSTEQDGAMEYDPSGLWFTMGSTRYLIPVNTAAGNYSNVQTIGNTTGSITMTPLAGNSVIVNSAAVSTSSSTGALVVNGGVGVAGAINSAGNISSAGTVAATTSMITPQIYGSTAASGDIRIDGTSDATKGNVLLASAGGRVGIGTTAPATAAKLDVQGQIRGGFVSGSSLTVDWTGGNIQETNAAAGTLNFTSGTMLNGSTYTLILTTPGTFTLGTAGDISTWRCLPACPGQQISATGHTMLSIVKAGTTGYVSWLAGF